MKMKSLILVVLLLVVLSQNKALKSSKIVKAINCGMREGFIRGDNDIKYESDKDLVSGKSVDVDYHSDATASAADIKYTMEKQLYMYERHTYSTMKYSLPVRNGVNTLILKFAEMYFEKPGQRVFDIEIGDTTVIKGMDVIEKTGSRLSAHEEYLEIEVNNGVVRHNSIVIKEALKQGKLLLSFSKGAADNPIIQGIIVYQGPASETTKEDYEKLKKNWGSHQELLKAKKESEKIRDLMAITKKKEKIVIRNDQLLLQDTQKGSNRINPQKFGTIRTLLMGPLGIILWSLLVLSKIFFLYKHVFKMSSDS